MLSAKVYSYFVVISSTAASCVMTFEIFKKHTSFTNIIHLYSYLKNLSDIKCSNRS